MYNDDYKDTQRYSNGNEESRYGSYHYSSYTEPEHGEKKTRKNNGFMKKAAICIVLALIFGSVSAAAFQVTDYVGDKIRAGLDEADRIVTDEDEVAEVLGEAIQSEKSAAAVSTVYDVSAVARDVMPSLVSITNLGVQEIQSFFGTYKQESESSGSGIIVGKNEKELLIATNNHVVEGSEQLNVCFIDGSISSALVKGTQSDKDLAVIAVSLDDISEETMDAISIAEIGDSDSLQIGEPVIAIGNALGYGQSVTTGVVSALDREVTIENMTNSLIQTDAAINPGNSGGALLNMRGQVIGINSAKLASSQIEGMGYAIPISTAEPILNELMNRVTRTKVADEDRGYLGITGADVTASVSQQMGIPEGAVVVTVTDGTGAADAGLKKGDIIVKFDGVTIGSMTSLKDTLLYYEAGESVEVAVMRANDGEYVEKTFTVTLSDYKTIQSKGEPEPQLRPDFGR